MGATKVPRRPTDKAIVQVRIELRGTKPKVWRRVLVPQTITLLKLHLVIQAAFGWGHAHLHEFIAGDGGRYGSADPMYDPPGTINVCVWPWHLELTWPAREHRVHGERGGCGLVEGNGICRSLARRYRAGRVHHRSSGGRLGPAPCVGPVDPGGFSLQAATGGAATPRSGCSTASAAA